MKVVLQLAHCRIESVAQDDLEVFVRAIGARVTSNGNLSRGRRDVDADGEQVALGVMSVW